MAAAEPAFAVEELVEQAELGNYQNRSAAEVVRNQFAAVVMMAGSLSAEIAFAAVGNQ